MTTRRFDDVIEVGFLPAPSLVEPLDFPTIVGRMTADYQTAWPEWTDETEFEPVRAHLHVDAYTELVLRERINEAARATQLALAIGSDLDIHGASRELPRKVITPADPAAVPPVEAVLEDDDDYRKRLQLHPEGFSTCGPEGAYVKHAKDVATVEDATAVSPEPAEALITVMAFEADGVASQAVLDAVQAHLSQERLVPFTDRITVRSVQPVTHAWTGQIVVKRGADPSVVMAEVERRANVFADALRMIGLSAGKVQSNGALDVPGVHSATHSLEDGLAVTEAEFIHITSITFSYTVAGDE